MAWAGVPGREGLAVSGATEPAVVLNLRTLHCEVVDGRLVVSDGDTTIELRGGGPEAATGCNELAEGAGQMWARIDEENRQPAAEEKQD